MAASTSYLSSYALQFGLSYMLGRMRIFIARSGVGTHYSEDFFVRIKELLVAARSEPADWDHGAPGQSYPC